MHKFKKYTSSYLFLTIFCSVSSICAAEPAVLLNNQNNAEKGIFYQNLPDYQKKSPFTQDAAILTNVLRSAIDAAKMTSDCSTIKIPNWGTIYTKANVCNKDAEKIKIAIQKIAPSLDINNMTFYKIDIDKDRKPEFLLGYYEIVRQDRYIFPYFYNFIISEQNNKTSISVDGPMLAGGIHKIKNFGSHNKNTIFYKYSHCVGCEAFEYLLALEYTRDQRTTFKFIDDSTGVDALEYKLPTSGWSPSGTIETRIPINTSSDIHLLQKYVLEDGKIEWRQFTCKNYDCRFVMAEQKNIPKHLKAIWQTAKPL